jgi:tellurite methyltransferase
MIHPATLLREHQDLFLNNLPPGPLLDLACGECHNGIYLALKGIPVICCDRSSESLERTTQIAQSCGVTVKTWQLDLEIPGVEPLPKDSFGGILVFRYLHRPLIPCIKRSIKRGGLLMYETFTIDQRRFGKPRNPDFLLEPGELAEWFKEWELLHYFEGIKKDPHRAIAQIVCRKP